MCLENSEVREQEKEDVIVLQGPRSFKMFRPCAEESHYLCSEETEDSRCLCLCHEEEANEKQEIDLEEEIFY